jgi:hypothetical protein
MDLALFATTIGLVELLIGLPFLFSTKKTVKWLKGFMREDVLLRIVGGVLLLLGALTLIDEYGRGVTYGGGLDGFVRLIAWLVAIKGILLAWWPGWVWKMSKKWLDNEGLLSLGALAKVLLGIFLLWAGTVL